MSDSRQRIRRPYLIVAVGIALLALALCFVEVFIIDGNGVTLRIYHGAIQYPADWGIVRQALYPRCSSAGVPPKGVWIALSYPIFRDGTFVLLILLWIVSLSFWYAGKGWSIRSSIRPLRLGVAIGWGIIALFTTVLSSNPLRDTGTRDLCVFLTLAVVMPLLHVRIFPVRQETIDELRACRACGYNLFANVSGICPECGTAIPDEQRNYL